MVKTGGSRRNIGNELHAQQGHVILELQFALLETAQLKFIVMHVADQRVDDGIEVTVLDFEFDQAALDILW